MVEAAFHFPRNSCGARPPPRIRWRATTPTTTGGSGSSSPGTSARRALRPGLRLVGRPLAEDFDRAAAAGQNAHRLSVEWSRIEPAPGRWDDVALDHYREMLRGLRQRGLAPMVTLHHFTNPLWLAERVAGRSDASSPRFERFTRKVVEALHDLTSTCGARSTSPTCTPTRPTPRATSRPARRRPRHGLPRDAQCAPGACAAYHAIHEMQPAARVGIALHYRGCTPDTPRGPLDRAAARWRHAFSTSPSSPSQPTAACAFRSGAERCRWLAARRTFIGLNYYTATGCASTAGRVSCSADASSPPGADLSPTGLHRQ